MDDLKQKREQTKEMDVRYNATAHKNSYGVGQAASQAIGASIEWQTDQHQIIGFLQENKLCKVGAMLRSQDHNISWGTGCYANSLHR